MANRQRSTASESPRTVTAGGGSGGATKASEGRNKRRREQYATDTGHREKVKRQSRQTYRNQTGVNVAAKTLLVEGTTKEVYTEDMDVPVYAEVYTIPESAKAIGKTPLTLKRWIGDEMIPAPRLVDCVNGYKHYSKGELQIISELLRIYSKDYSYLVAGNENPFVHTVRQKLEAYRRQSI